MKCYTYIEKEHEEEVIIYAHEKNQLVKDIENLVNSSLIEIKGVCDDEIKILNPIYVSCFISEANKVYALIGDKRYKIQYKYRSLLKTDVIDKITGLGEMSVERKPAEMLKGIIGLTAEMLLAGLQANHADEFGYDTEAEHEKRILEILDLMDEYDAENVDENGKQLKDSFSLFSDLQAELESNSFLSSMTRATRRAAENQNATVVPMDHQAKQKAKAGVKK